MSNQSRFYAPVFNLLGRELPFSEKNNQFLLDFQARHNLVLPASLVEWYSYEGSFEIIAQTGVVDEVYQFNQLAEDDSFDDLYEVFIAQNKFWIIQENYSIFKWVLDLADASNPDPPVFDVIEQDSETAPDFKLYVDKFSNFVYTRLWDTSYFDSGWVLWAVDQLLTEKEFLLLKEHFAEDVRTYGGLCEVKYRFYSGSKRIFLWTSVPEVGMDTTGDVSDWHLWAATKEELEELIGIVWGIGTLSETLMVVTWDHKEYYEEISKFKDRLTLP